MADNLFNVQYDVTKKSKFKVFYDNYKTTIYSVIVILIISFIAFNFYLDSKGKQRVLLSENYLQAKLYLDNKNNVEALNILKSVIFANDPTYSTLSLFTIINQNLIIDHQEISNLFNHVLDKNKFSKELKNLLIFKKALFDSSFVDEDTMIKSLSALINSENIWKPHAIILLGDYFMSKGESLKAIEFYQKIFTLNNLQQDLYNHARYQLLLISNE